MTWVNFLFRKWDGAGLKEISHNNLWASASRLVVSATNCISLHTFRRCSCCSRVIQISQRNLPSSNHIASRKTFQNCSQIAMEPSCHRDFHGANHTQVPQLRRWPRISSWPRPTEGGLHLRAVPGADWPSVECCGRLTKCVHCEKLQLQVWEIVRKFKWKFELRLEQCQKTKWKYKSRREWYSLWERCYYLLIIMIIILFQYFLHKFSPRSQ